MIKHIKDIGEWEKDINIKDLKIDKDEKKKKEVKK
jgi:hypothetical protein